MLTSIGVEIEGAWNELPESFFNDNNKHHHKIYRSDGSVSGLTEVLCLTCNKNRRYCQCEINNFDSPDVEQSTFKFVGECASYPYHNINNLLLWVDQYYPIKTNNTCGLHVHVKPQNLQEYQKLMSKKFYRDYINAIQVWAKSRNVLPDSELYKRLKGKNRYVLRGFKPHQNGQDPEHYRLINYCYSKHGTIEFRLLPAFQSKALARDSIRFTYDFINIWLVTNEVLSNKPIKISKTIELGDL